MSKVLYEEENIRAIAERIRANIGGDATYTTSQMPDAIDEVYNKGYDDSVLDRTYTLYGTYMLVYDAWDYIGVEGDVTLDFASDDLYVASAYFTHRDDYEIWPDYIGSIHFEKNTIRIYNFYGDSCISLEDGVWYASTGDDGYHEYISNDKERVIIFSYPVQVSQEVYNAFVSVMDMSTSVYEAGENEGYRKGLAEFLYTELMEWQVTSTSTDCTVTIYNKHPTKHLLAELEVLENVVGSSWVKNVNLDPGEDCSFSYSAQSLYSAHWEVNVSKVKFSLS